MCGISGIISKKSIAWPDLVAMNSVIRHRGPDDEGYVFFTPSAPVCLGGDDGHDGSTPVITPYSPRGHVRECDIANCSVAFGHRRLSIVDLSPLGHQPMCSANGRYWITYNGEVYNYRELRRELESVGFHFISNTDTEVILAAYEFWGEDCQNRFNGMWAFAIYDVLQHQLFLSRDRFGVKPLYYWQSSQGFLAFASEIKQFTVLPGWQPRVNGQRAYDYLFWGVTDHTDETLFAGVFQLRQGQCCIVDMRDWRGSLTNGRLPVRQWYQMQKSADCSNMVAGAAEVQRLLFDSVELRVRADVPVGSCLSGGLDSSSIVCIINRLLEKHPSETVQKTFSSCTDVKEYDEKIWIDHVCSQANIDAHFVYPELDGLFAELPQIVWHQDEPFGSTSIFAQWNVFKIAALQSIRVMLDGQGADETLAGYHSYFPSFLTGKLLQGDFIPLLREMRALNRMHGYSLAQQCGFIAGQLLSDETLTLIKRCLGHDTQGSSFLWLEHSLLNAQTKNPLKAIRPDVLNLHAFSECQLYYLTLPMLLHWEDRDSMAHSIESRLPFLDYRFVEYVMSLPDDYKVSGGVTKKVLREGMKGILPEPVRQRVDKLGFATPEEVWIRHNPRLFQEKLLEAVDHSKGILRAESLDVFKDILDGKQPFSFIIWRMISFGAWMNTFAVQLNSDRDSGISNNQS